MTLCDNPKTVEDLLVFTVRAMLTDFREIYHEIMLVNQAVSGKIGDEGSKGKTEVPEKKAVETALQAFEDGLVAVFVDGERYESLEDKLELSGEETITFVRLAMLAGRMW